ncbi:hypothetical protein CRUP_030649, partial [Coryphaenoides rupestris]
VEELRRDLRIKSQELEVKNAAANDKLKKMVKDQQEAEKKKVMSQEIQESVYKQQEVIKDKQLSVKVDLDQVEPAVIEAQNAVKSIKKQHLVEVRSMANPPAAVKVALESICLLLGESTTDWKQIRSIIMRENFIPTIVNFSADDISAIKRQHLVEVRAMTNPPAAVKLALESICLLLGEETSDWKKIRQVVIRENFISSIVNFSSEEMRYWYRRR